jgi:hypothetical protein
MHANMHTKIKCICTDVHVYFCTQSHHDGRAKGDQIRERKREMKREREREREGEGERERERESTATEMKQGKKRNPRT